MTYYPDLSRYHYGEEFYRPGTKNIGWLSVGHEFETAEPTDVLLDRLWAFCKISVARSRGGHYCELCPGKNVCEGERNGERLLLGTAEIRVFHHSGEIYAAPTLIYHYVEAHKYKPPEAFIQSLVGELAPPSKGYFERLAQLGLEWRETVVPMETRVRPLGKPPGA
jgi:hypothetical protein